jgi:tetratricopeptide (TPR) repeat protein
MEVARQDDVAQDAEGREPTGCDPWRDPVVPGPLARATTLCQLMRFADAVAAVSVTLAESPRDSDAWCLMAEAQLGNDRPAAALQAARAAASLAPDQEYPERLASLALSCLGHGEEAVEAALQATRRNPAAWQAQARLAESLAAFPDRAADAQRALERSRSLAPGEPGPHLAGGAVALAAGRPADAAAAFCAALAVDPQCLEAHHQLAGVEVLGPRRDPSRLRRAIGRIRLPWATRTVDSTTPRAG